MRRVDSSWTTAIGMCPTGAAMGSSRRFERVEVKPQALEWLLNIACDRRFRVSADNLKLGLGASDSFKRNIQLQAQAYCREGR